MRFGAGAVLDEGATEEAVDETADATADDGVPEDTADDGVATDSGADDGAESGADADDGADAAPPDEATAAGEVVVGVLDDEAATPLSPHPATSAQIAKVAARVDLSRMCFLTVRRGRTTFDDRKAAANRRPFLEAG